MGRGRAGAREGRRGPKSTPPTTLEEWAAYGIGEPDADGLYADYRVPPELKPPAPGQSGAGERRAHYGWWHLAQHWDAVHTDLAEIYGVDLHDPAVLARPWPGVRLLIVSLLTRPCRLLTRLEGDRT